MPKTKLIHVITKLELGGAQEHVLMLLGALPADRYEKVLICGTGGYLDPRAEAMAGVTVHFLDALRGPLHPLRDLRAFFGLIRIIRRERASSAGARLIVQTHSSKAGVLGRLAGRLAGADFVLHTVHGFGVREGDASLRGRVLLAAERLASRATDLFLPVASENVRTGERLGLFDASRAIIVRPGFDVARFARSDRGQARRALGLGEDEPVVGTVACFKPQKGPHDFVRAAERIAERIPRARFVWIGDGEMRPGIEEAIRGAGLGSRFRLLGWREDVPELMAGFDVFVLTSYWEGVPKVVPQALIAGVPVVATAVDGTQEVVSDGRDGFLVPPGDADAVADRVVALLTGERRLDPRSGFDRLSREFDAGEAVRRQDEVYRSLLAGADGKTP